MLEFFSSIHEVIIYIAAIKILIHLMHHRCFSFRSHFTPLFLFPPINSKHLQNNPLEIPQQIFQKNPSQFKILQLFRNDNFTLSFFPFRHKILKLDLSPIIFPWIVQSQLFLNAFCAISNSTFYFSITFRAPHKKCTVCRTMVFQLRAAILNWPKQEFAPLYI